jgi:hypothetical protein
VEWVNTNMGMQGQGMSGGMGGMGMGGGMGGGMGNQNAVGGGGMMGGGPGTGGMGANPTQGAGAGAHPQQAGINHHLMQQLYAILRNPNHPMMKFMLQSVPGFENLPVNQQMHRLMVARVRFRFL